MDEIALKNMVFYGYHGNISEENSLGQRFFVDLVLRLDLKAAGSSDCVEETVNYADVYNIVQSIMEGPPYHLIERVGTIIAEEIRQTFSKVEEVEVRIRKPAAPIPGVLDYAEVVIRR